jgi:hypothetical protein
LEFSYNFHKVTTTVELKQSRSAQATVGGKLVSESRSLGGWISTNEIAVNGELVFSKGKCSYSYVLTLKPGGTGMIDRGGFEEGILTGSNYQVTN